MPPHRAIARMGKTKSSNKATLNAAWRRYFADRLGLDTGSIGEDNLARSIGRLCKEAGLSQEDYYHRASSSGEVPRELREAWLVPETWFMRGRPSLDALVDYCRTACDTAPPSRLFRVLSVPCSTGEEPYSIAMALDQAGLPPDRYRIDGIDVCEEFLLRAREGIYPAASFRGNPASLRQTYFQATGSRWKLNEPIRRRVRFRQEDATAGDFLANRGRYDVVFCRNLLIYLTEPARARLLERVRQSLCTEGRFFVGHAETTIVRHAGWHMLGEPQAFCFVPAAPSAAPSPCPTPGPYRRKTVRSHHHTATSGKARLPPPPRPEPPSATPPSTSKPGPPRLPGPGDLPAIQRLADAGRFPEARNAADDYIRTHPFEAEGFFWMGLIEAALEQDEHARQAFRKALYLDPGHTATLQHLGLLCQRMGRHDEARRLERRWARAQTAPSLPSSSSQ